MINKNMFHRKICGVFLGVFLALSLSACGKQDQLDNMQMGWDAMEALDYEGALGYFDLSVEAGENPVSVNRARGLAYMGMGEYEKAIEAFALALSAGKPTAQKVDYDINYYIAVCDYKLGRYSDALERYNAILALEPKERDALYLRGVMQLELNQYEAAVADFDAALLNGKKDYGLYIDIYSALAQHDYRDEGKVYLQTAMDNDSDEMSDYDRGRIYYYLENYEYARNYLEKSRTNESKNPEVALMLGQAYEALNDCNYAVTVYEDFLKIQEDAAVYNQLGLCRMKLADYEGALVAFRNGIALDDKDYRQSLKFNEIVVTEKLSRYEEAESLMVAYLSLYPEDAEAKREEQFLKTR